MRNISMSIQASDLLDLRTEIKKYIKAGIDSIHFDVMDHQYANNFAFGPDIFKAIKKEFEGLITIDVHFMITNPTTEIEKFIELKPEIINVDALSLSKNELVEVTNKIKAAGIKAGIAIQIEDKIEDYDRLIPNLDSIMLMSVPIGKAGQKFNDNIFSKIKYLQKNFDLTNKLIGLDGGVRLTNFEAIANAGFNFIVIGSILKGETNYDPIIQKLKSY